MKYLKRQIDKELEAWKSSEEHKPLLLRGARQVGKSSAIRHLGESFPYFLEVNFERDKTVKEFFDGDLDVKFISEQLSHIIGCPLFLVKPYCSWMKYRHVPMLFIVCGSLRKIIPNFMWSLQVLCWNLL